MVDVVVVVAVVVLLVPLLILLLLLLLLLLMLCPLLTRVHDTCQALPPETFADEFSDPIRTMFFKFTSKHHFCDKNGQERQLLGGERLLFGGIDYMR